MFKLDFGAVLISIVIVVLIIIVFLLAIPNIITTYQTKSAEASMYSKPSWYEITTTTTTEEISSEEIEELKDEFEDEGVEE